VPTTPCLHPTAIHFIRHGEVHNPKGLFYGRLPGFHLSEKGFEEAAAVGPQVLKASEAVAAVVPSSTTPVVLHSPLLRARETAEVMMAAGMPFWEAKPHDPELREDPRLLEVNLPFEGRPMSELIALGLDKVYQHGQEGMGFENFGQVFGRVRSLVASLVADDATAGRHIYCICHGDICLAARLWAYKGATAVEEGHFARKDVPYPGHCSVTTLLTVADGEAWPTWQGSAWPAVHWVQSSHHEEAAAAAAAERVALEAAAEERRAKWRAGQRGHTPLA
jgi:broad specificity phosphatase PhoE